ncbi:MAG: hypothetical protein ACUVWP_09650 [bacterium]
MKSDGYLQDWDFALWIGCDDSCAHHCFSGENYQWNEYNPELTCMIRVKIEFETGPGINNTSLGIIKSIFH